MRTSRDNAILLSNLSQAFFRNSIFSTAAVPNITLSTLTGAKLNGANLVFAKLNDQDLSGVDFSNANLAYADLTNTDLSNTNMYNAKLDNTIFDESKFFNTKIDEKNLLKIKQLDIDISGIYVSNPNAPLSTVEFNSENPKNLFKKSNSPGEDFSNLSISGINVDEANFTGSTISNSKFPFSKLVA